MQFLDSFNSYWKSVMDRPGVHPNCQVSRGFGILLYINRFYRIRPSRQFAVICKSTFFGARGVSQCAAFFRKFTSLGIVKNGSYSSTIKANCQGQKGSCTTTRANHLLRLKSLETSAPRTTALPVTSGTRYSDATPLGKITDIY